MKNSKNKAVVSLNHVTKSFSLKEGEFTAVREVSFSIKEGEFVSIVGPSGCGKSTVLGMISGIIPITSGTIVINGNEVNRIRGEVGYLFQRDALLPWKTVMENVMLSLIFRKVEKTKAIKKAEEWIDKVGLTGFEDYFPHRLSGGMRKRVSLAMTLVYNPQIILMDEPFSALDVQTRNLMENEVLEIWAEFRKTILFVTHDLEEAIALSDRVIVFSSCPGRVKEEYEIGLGRPRNVTDIRFHDMFNEIYLRIWRDLKEEVQLSYERCKRNGPNCSE